MFRLITFGQLALWREGESAPVAGVQRRPLSLLAILAASAPSGMSREKVIAILWPESDSESAKASLRQAVFAARRELGSDDVIRGSNELSLNPQLINSDVSDFRAAIASKNYEEALDLYRGPFLDGVQARNSGGFERWVESQRGLLAADYRAALEKLALGATTSAGGKSGIEFWRRLVHDDPLSSRYAAGLMEALLSVGDSGGALSHYRVHELLVRKELASAPDPALVQIAERARRLRSVDVPAISDGEPVVAAPSGPAPLPGTLTASTIAPGPGATRTRRNWLVIGAVTFAILLVIGAVAARNRPGSESVRRIVVAPFDNRTGDSRLDAIGPMASDWITDGLSRAGFVSVIDPATAFFAAKDARERSGSIAGNSTAVKAISLATDADIVTTGDYYRRGDSIEFHARVTDARDNRVMASMEAVVVAATASTAGVEVVRQRVLGILARELDARLSDNVQAQSSPPTFDAYREYTRGLEFFVTRQSYPDAVVHFRRAYEIDTSFAGALLWASLAYQYEGKPDEARALLDTLLPRRRDLTPLDAYALDAMRAYNAGKIDASISSATAAAAIAPRSEWVWNAGYWSVGANRPRAAIRFFESLDPARGWLKGWPDYWIKLAGAEHMVGDYKAERATIDRGLALYPMNGRLQWQMASNLAARGSTRALDSTAIEKLASPDPVAGLVFGHLVFELREHGQAADADRLSTRAEPYFAKWSGTAEGLSGLGDVYFMGRRWKDARRQYELALALPDASPYQDLDLRSQVGVCAAILGDTAAAISIANSLGQIAGEKRGEATFGRALILARLHRRPDAVTLLRESYALGFRKTYYVGHTTRYLFPDLWGYPPFEEFYKQD